MTFSRAVLLAIALAPALQAQAVPSDIPPKRAHHAIVYDDANGRVLITGGSSPFENGNCCAMFNDLWSFDGTKWTALPPSGPQMSGMRLAYDSRSKRVVSFGGWINGQSQTAFRALEQDAWVPLVPHTEMPASEPGMVYDSRRHRFVAFGGSGGRGQVNGDTWEFDGSAWRKIVPAGTAGPEARQAFMMVFDERRGRTVAFGGMRAATPPTPRPPLGDLWEYDGREWVQIETTGGPSPRHSAGATYDSKRGRVIVFGGLGTSGMLGDLWAWDGHAWTRLADASAEGPEPRAMGYIAYDRKRDRVVLFGGRKGWPNDLNDTWEWDGTRWRRVR